MGASYYNGGRITGAADNLVPGDGELNVTGDIDATGDAFFNDGTFTGNVTVTGDLIADDLKVKTTGGNLRILDSAGNLGATFTDLGTTMSLTLAGGITSSAGNIEATAGNITVGNILFVPRIVQIAADTFQIQSSGFATNFSVAEATGNVTVRGDVSLSGDLIADGVLESAVVTGTAPFIVASTTVVTNLNADLLDGLHAASFALLTGATFTGAVSIDGSADVTQFSVKGHSTQSATSYLIHAEQDGGIDTFYADNSGSIGAFRLRDMNNTGFLIEAQTGADYITFMANGEFRSPTADGASAIGFKFGVSADFTTSGAKIASFGDNAGTSYAEKAYVDKDGSIGSGGMIRSTGEALGGSAGLGAELYVTGGTAYFGSYNRTSATSQPIQMRGSTLSLAIESTAKLSIDASGNTTMAGTAARSIGGSTSVAPVPTTASVNTTAVGNVDTGEDDLMSYAVPANTLSANGRVVKITAWGTSANNANAKTLKLKVASTNILTFSMSVSVAGRWDVEAYVIRTGVDAQDYKVHLDEQDSAFTSPSGMDIEVGSLTEDDGAAITIKMTGEGVATNDIVQEGMIVEVLN